MQFVEESELEKKKPIGWQSVKVGGTLVLFLVWIVCETIHNFVDLIFFHAFIVASSTVYILVELHTVL